MAKKSKELGAEMTGAVTSETYLDFAQELADCAGAVTAPLFRKPLSVEDKNRGGADIVDPVTRADREAEAAIRALISERYPDHGILGEEMGAQRGSSPMTWVIDPIDGTRAFVSGFPVWGTLIALNDGTRPVIGVADQPYTGERFMGWPGGAQLKAAGGMTPLKVRSCESLSSAIVSTTDPAGFPNAADEAAFIAVRDSTMLHRYGGDCYAYCLLAMGCLDLVIESGLKPWDVQALIPIVEGAGGLMTDWRGGPAYDGAQVIAAGDARVHAEALAILASAAL